MLTVVCADKGSPGVTATALALAAAWPRPAVVVEADAAGGDLAVRMYSASGGAVPETPTVATLAAEAGRAESWTTLVSRHAFRINDQLAVVPGFLSAEAGGGMSGLWDDLATALAGSEVDVVADLGRVHSASPTMRIVEAADAVVVAARHTSSSLLHLRERIGHLHAALGGRRGAATMVPSLVPLLVTGRRHAMADVAETTEILQAAGLSTLPVTYLAWDVAALASIEHGADPHGRALVRSLLIRSARPVAEQLAALGAGIGAGGSAPVASVDGSRR